MSNPLNPTPDQFSAWLDVVLDSSKSDLEREMAASCINVAYAQAVESARLLRERLLRLVTT